MTPATIMAKTIKTIGIINIPIAWEVVSTVASIAIDIAASKVPPTYIMYPMIGAAIMKGQKYFINDLDL